METKKRAIQNQKSIIEQKLKPWLKLRKESAPPSGWVRAIRGALGISSRQLAKLLEVDHSAVIRMEQREKQKKITLELLDKAADAMECELIYAIVPRDNYSSLNNILEEKALTVAKQVIQKVEHTMRLEAQGQSKAQLKKQLKELASEIKDQMDSRLWEEVIKKNE